MFQRCYSALGGNIFLGCFLKEGASWGQSCGLVVSLSSLLWEPPGSFRLKFTEGWKSPKHYVLEVSKILCSCKLISKGDGGGSPQTQLVVWVQEEQAPGGVGTDAPGCGRSFKQGGIAAGTGELSRGMQGPGRLGFPNSAPC